MKRIGELGIAVLAVALGGWVLATPKQRPAKAEYVMSADRAYMVMNPEPVAATNVRSVEWSPTGRFLMMIQETPTLSPAQTVDVFVGRPKPKSDFRLLTYDRQLRTVRDHGSLSSLFGNPDYLEYYLRSGLGPRPWQWFVGVDVCYTASSGQTVSEENYYLEELEFTRFDVERGSRQVTRIAGPGGYRETMVGVQPAPTLPLFLELQSFGNNGAFRVRVRTQDYRGRQSAFLDLGEGLPRFRGWYGDGTIAKIDLILLENRTIKTLQSVFYSVVKESVEVFATAPEPYRAASKLPPVEIRTTPTKTEAGVVRVDHKATWLSATGPSEDPAVLLSTDAERAAISPKLDCIAVLTKGLVTLRPVAILNRSAIEDAMRYQAVVAAKEIGLGLLMYANDYDDEFPLASHYEEDGVLPYLKDGSWMKDFIYRFPGGPMRNAPQTMLGYIPGPGGYAVVYADGRAEWKTGPPPKGE